jgi:biopolymer transport protein ExbD
MKIKTPAHDDVGFQMAPMIDCVFQLMIFFMCASHLHVTLDSPPIQVPVAVNASIPEELTDRRYLTLQADGSVLLGGAPIPLAQVKTEIEKAVTAVPNLKIFLRADARLPHKKVKEVMSALAEGGASEIIFAAYQSEAL